MSLFTACSVAPAAPKLCKALLQNLACFGLYCMQCVASFVLHLMYRIICILHLTYCIAYVSYSDCRFKKGGRGWVNPTKTNPGGSSGRAGKPELKTIDQVGFRHHLPSLQRIVVTVTGCTSAVLVDARHCTTLGRRKAGQPTTKRARQQARAVAQTQALPASTQDLQTVTEHVVASLSTVSNVCWVAHACT